MPLTGVVGVLSLEEAMWSGASRCSNSERGAMGVGTDEDPIVGNVKAGEEGVILAGRSASAGFEEAGPLIPLSVGTDEFRFAGVDILSASARAAAMDEALGKRAAGSFARLRVMTSARAGVTLGLMRFGGVGKVLRCCMIIETGLSP